MIKRKYIIFLVGAFILAFGVSKMTGYVISSNTPEFVMDKFNELKKDQVLMDSIGGYKSFQYTFNKKDFKAGRDVRFQINIYGKEKELIFEGVQVKGKDSKWVLSKSEIVIE